MNYLPRGITAPSRMCELAFARKGVAGCAITSGHAGIEPAYCQRHALSADWRGLLVIPTKPCCPDLMAPFSLGRHALVPLPCVAAVMVPGATCFSPDALQVTIRKQPCALHREHPAAGLLSHGPSLSEAVTLKNRKHWVRFPVCVAGEPADWLMAPGATCFSPDALQVTIRKQPCALHREPPAAGLLSHGPGPCTRVVVPLRGAFSYCRW